MILADAAQPDGALMLQGFLLVNIVLTAVMAVRNIFFPAKTAVSPQPFEIRGATEYARKETFDQHVKADHEEHAHLFAKLSGVERGIRGEVKSDVAQVSGEVNRLRESVAALNHATNAQDRQLESMDKKLDQLGRDIRPLVKN